MTIMNVNAVTPKAVSTRSVWRDARKARVEAQRARDRLERRRLRCGDAAQQLQRLMI
jgi:hypothetical protein